MNILAKYPAPWRLQHENKGHGMSVETRRSVATGDAIIWAGNDGDIKFADEQVEILVLSAPEILSSLIRLSQTYDESCGTVSDSSMKEARLLLSRIPGTSQNTT